MLIKDKFDPYRDFFGVDDESKRLQENINAFKSIADEIRKLRSLDLTNIHPAIIFEPTAVYRKKINK
jgi:hypothetical protein